MPSRIIVSKEVADLFKVLAHPDRVRLVEELRDGEKDVTGIAHALNLPTTRTSQHLAALRSHRLVSDRREGRQHFYRLTRPAMAGWIVDALQFLEVRSPIEEGSHLEAVRRLWAPDLACVSNKKD
ncbi:MAG: helix-turn-helix transcriptional regulator [Porphyrobacter sp.]|nr:helix-turn-helix transcriptional regulator [Porphyrobacter sp.]